MTDWHRFSIRHSTTSRPEVGNWQFPGTGRLPEGWLGGVMGPEVGHLTDSCERLLNLYTVEDWRYFLLPPEYTQVDLALFRSKDSESD